MKAEYVSTKCASVQFVKLNQFSRLKLLNISSDAQLMFSILIRSPYRTRRARRLKVAVTVPAPVLKFAAATP
ncbi:hypothetical protein LMG28138_03887 [Pararobbsia alpina]|uniref:Uncharacterized protein n=1 Tax=Pararobbsia alpina TaxID=621374 RepID=A0A6S7D472_9BURK|nr:hypothetical protein LMG28138_03887 [Pararobbsia alpina]